MGSDSQSDSQLLRLIQQARDGDAGARDVLFTRCRNYLNVVAQSQLQSWLQAKVDASDLVQQTLLEAHQGLSNFHGETDAQWLAWLRKLLEHNAADVARQYQTGKRQVRRERPLDRFNSGSAFGSPEPAAVDETPSQQMLAQERELQLADALAQLPPDYQEVIMLRNLQRLSFNQVAEQLGRSRPATQMLWMRALRKLEEVLGEWPP